MIPRLAIIPGGFREYRLRVAHPQQAEPLGGGGFFDILASLLLPSLAERIQAQPALAHAHQLAHEQPHHAVKKAAGLDLCGDQVAMAHQAHLLNRGAGMGAPTAGLLEGREIVLAHQLAQGRCHGLVIEQAVVAVPAPGGQEEIRGAGVVQRVAVAPVAGAIAGVPVGGDCRRRPHPNGARQPSIEGLCPALGRNWTCGVEVHHLGRRMHARVRPARGNGMHRPVGIKLGNGLVEAFLDAGGVVLPLPTAKRRPVVLEAKGNPLHRWGRAGLAIGHQTRHPRKQCSPMIYLPIKKATVNRSSPRQGI